MKIILSCLSVMAFFLAIFLMNEWFEVEWYKTLILYSLFTFGDIFERKL